LYSITPTLLLPPLLAAVAAPAATASVCVQLEAAAAETAIKEMNDQEFMGRALWVSWGYY
jgi:hypothetical protein